MALTLTVAVDTASWIAAGRHTLRPSGGRKGEKMEEQEARRARREESSRVGSVVAAGRQHYLGSRMCASSDVVGG